jgi:hypothetical protein
MNWRWKLSKLVSLLPQTRRLRTWNYGTLGPGRRPTKKERAESQRRLEEFLKNNHA